MYKLLFFLSFFIYLIPNNHIMSYEEYASIEHSIPYTVDFSSDNQHLFYFGANHSCDPNNMQYPILKEFWNRFIDKTQGKKCVVLVEGSLRSGPFFSEENSIIEGGGEGGFITFLAYQSHIPIECPEPTEKYLYYELIKHFSPDEVDYKIFAQCIVQFNRYKKIDPNLDFDHFFIDRCYGNQCHLEKMKQLHNTFFETVFNPHDEMFFYHITNPIEAKTIINHICRQASIIRDMHIIDYLDNLIQQGKNIFIVYGCTHAVMQEVAISHLWNQYIVNAGQGKFS